MAHLPATQPTSPILVPRPIGVQCGYCPKLIFKNQEAGGRLFLMNGRPACARCRIMKDHRMASRIRDNILAYKKDFDARTKREQESEDRKIREIALKSQKRTGTKKRYRGRK